MGNRELHSKIRQKFGIKRRRDNLPLCGGKRYNRNLLPELLAENDFDYGAEVGVRKGAFSKKFLLANPNLRLLCIDPWGAYHGISQPRQDGYFNYAVKNLSEFGDRVKFIRKPSMDALPDVEDNSLDFVYIDGNHRFDYVMADIIFWSQKVSRGGVVGCHDYYAFGWGGVREAVDAYTRCHHIDPWYVTKELEPSAFWVKP
jgi:hypothetical protein